MKTVLYRYSKGSSYKKEQGNMQSIEGKTNMSIIVYKLDKILRILEGHLGK